MTQNSAYVVTHPLWKSTDSSSHPPIVGDRLGVFLSRKPVRIPFQQSHIVIESICLQYGETREKCQCSNNRGESETDDDLSVGVALHFYGFLVFFSSKKPIFFSELK